LGYQAFAEAAHQADIDGVLTVDLPPEEAVECVALLKEQGIDQIFLLAPNSSDERIQKMDAVGSGYLYYVSLKGVTGAGNLNTQDVATKLTQIRNNTALPIGVGFGVKDAATAKIVAQLADGVVVGSALIEQIEQNLDNLPRAKEKIVELLTSMRCAMDS
jgi:tryptophan synthase alpha chain